MDHSLMTTPLRLGIAGLGTVGVGVVRVVQKHAALLELRAGRPVEIVAVSARSKTKDRGVDLSGYAWEDDPVTLAKRADIDVFIEVMGGHEGPAKDATEAAIANGKDVVSANKALLAIHGQALAEAAEAAGRVIRFEAAVAGGIPVVKALTEGLAGNEITRVMGDFEVKLPVYTLEYNDHKYNVYFKQHAAGLVATDWKELRLELEQGRSRK